VRVLHVIKAKGIGGAERHLLSLLPALRDAGAEVGLVVIAAERAHLLVEPMRRAGVPVHVVNAPRSPLSIGLLRRLVRQIEGFGPDLVHTHLIHGDVHGQSAARLAGVPGVSSIHSVHDFYRRNPYRLAASFAGRRAVRTIAISRYAGDFIVEAGVVPAERARVVYYGIEPSGWALSDERRLIARRDLGIDESDVVIGLASRLIDGKGHEDAIRGFGSAAASNHALRLLIAGDGPRRPQLESIASSIPGDRIRFAGFVDDVVALMNAVDVVCFPTQPSLGEGFGLAVLEAMAAARPVVATSIASLPEIVVDGKTGVLVRAHDPDGLAAAFLRLASDPGERRSMGAAAKARARSRFSLDEMVRGTVAVYEEAVA
jgi:glycosyltransferase involved in cell wall biosynthesis